MQMISSIYYNVYSYNGENSTVGRLPKMSNKIPCNLHRREQSVALVLSMMLVCHWEFSVSLVKVHSLLPFKSMSRPNG